MFFQVILPLAAILGGAYGLVLIYVWLAADKMLFPAPRPPGYADDTSIQKLSSGDGATISALHLPAESRNLLLYHHGNGEDLGHIRPLLESFQQKGLSVLAYDYPGYGTSTGQPSESGIQAAAEAVYQHAVQALGFQPEQIVLFGHSLGSGPACWLAARHPVAGLIIQSGFTSAFRVATRRRVLPWDRFNNLRKLRHIRCPLLVIHGTKDRVIAYSHAKKLLKEFRGEKSFLPVPGAGHNSVPETGGQTYWETVLHFADPSL